MLQSDWCVLASPDDPSGGIGGASELVEGEDRVLRVQAVLEQHLAAIRGVLEFEGDRAKGLEPVDVGEVPGLGVIVDHDEEVEIRMVVEPVQVGADRPKADEGQGVATIRQDPAELIESGEQPARHVSGHGRLLGFGLG